MLSDEYKKAQRRFNELLNWYIDHRALSSYKMFVLGDFPKGDPIMPGGSKFITVNEKKRTYVFPGGDRVVFEGVEAISVRSSGRHRLNMADGRLVIVQTGWLAIEIEGLEGWVF